MNENTKCHICTECEGLGSKMLWEGNGGNEHDSDNYEICPECEGAGEIYE